MPVAQTEELSGVLEIGYIKPGGRWGFGTLRVEAEGDDDLPAEHKVTGVFPDVINSGDTVLMRGRWDDNPRWGLQFKFTEMTSEMPQDRIGLIRCLDAFLPNVGQVRGAQIVDEFGSDKVLHVLEHEPEKLTKISGITEERAEEIHRSYMRFQKEWEASSYMFELGLSADWTKRLLGRYGAERVVKVIQDDPYILVREVAGFGFSRCEELAKALDIQKGDPRRLRAGVIEVLRRAVLQGHTFLPSHKLRKSFNEFMGRSLPDQIVTDLEGTDEIVEEFDGYYLPHLHHDERIVAYALRALRDTPFAIRVNQLTDNDLQVLNEGQSEAIEISMGKRILVLTGGPGTGKTFVLNYILRALEGQTVALAAPTGKAARRMEEMTGKKAETIHRLLDYGPDDSGAMCFRKDRIEEALVVIDEVSMLDITLAARLFERIDPRMTQVILIGDVDQLPSVGPGLVLRDVLKSGTIPSVRLTEIMRQDEASPIIFAAHDIRNGDAPRLDYDRGFLRIMSRAKKKEFPDPDEFLDAEFAFLVRDTVRLVRSLLQDGHASDTIQVLCPQNKSRVGAPIFNEKLREVFNPEPKDILTIGDKTFGLGDRVMQLKNTYRPRSPGLTQEQSVGLHPVFNGEIGEVTAINRGELSVLFGDQTIGVRGEELFNIQLAYAMTIHKSQGSEYPIVVIPLHATNRIYRNLFYTGVTRASETCYVVGRKSAIEKATFTEDTHRRFSSLRQRLLDDTEWDVTLPPEQGQWLDEEGE